MTADLMTVASENFGKLLGSFPLLEVDYASFRDSVVPEVLRSLEYFGAELQVAAAALVIVLIDL